MARPEQEIAALKRQLAARDAKLIEFQKVNDILNGAWEEKFDVLKFQHEQALKDLHAARERSNPTGDGEDAITKLKSKVTKYDALLIRAHNDLVVREYLLGVALNALRPFANAAPDFQGRQGCILNPTMHSREQHHLAYSHLEQAARAVEIFNNNLRNEETSLSTGERGLKQPEVRKEEQITMKQFILGLLSAILSLQKTENGNQKQIQDLQKQVKGLGDRTDENPLNDPVIQQQLQAVLTNAANQPPQTATAVAPPVGTIGQESAPESAPTGSEKLGDGIGAPQAPQGAETGTGAPGANSGSTTGGASNDTGAPGAGEQQQSATGQGESQGS